MKKATGHVDYDVLVWCPSCNARLQLNQYPYTDEDGDYGHTEDLLGDEIFGTPDNPAQWKDFEIEYKCHGCGEHFLLTKLEI